MPQVAPARPTGFLLPPLTRTLPSLISCTGGTGTPYEDIINLAGGLNLPGQEFEGYKEVGDEAIPT